MDLKDLNEMVRDFTQIVPRPKSEVRRRITQYTNSKLKEQLEEIKTMIVEEINLDYFEYNKTNRFIRLSNKIDQKLKNLK